MGYTNRNFTWDFDALKRFYEKYIVKWLNSAVSWTEAQKKQARANLGFGDGDIDSVPTAGSDNLVKSGGVQKADIGITKNLSTEINSYTNINYGITEDGTFGTNSDSRHAVVPVSEGDRYILGQEVSVLYEVKFAFATSSDCTSGGNIPLVPGTSVMAVPKLNHVLFTIPSGCSYLLFSYGNNYKPVLYKGYGLIEQINENFGQTDNNTQEIEQVEKDLCNEVTHYAIENCSILSDGTFGNGTSATAKHGCIPVTVGEKYLVISSNSSNTRYAFATSNAFVPSDAVPLVPGTSVVSLPKNSNVLVTIPEGCSYLLINVGGAYPFKVKKYLGTDVLDDKLEVIDETLDEHTEQIQELIENNNKVIDITDSVVFSEDGSYTYTTGAARVSDHFRRTATAITIPNVQDANRSLRFLLPVFQTSEGAQVTFTGVCFFKDVDGVETFISGVRMPKGVYGVIEKYIDIPQDATSMKFSYWNASDIETYELPAFFAELHINRTILADIVHYNDINRIGADNVQDAIDVISDNLSHGILIGNKELYVSEVLPNQSITSAGFTTFSNIYDAYDALCASYPNLIRRQDDIGYDEDGNAIRRYMLVNYLPIVGTAAMYTQETVPKVNTWDKYFRYKRFLVTSGVHGDERVPVIGLLYFLRDLLASDADWATFIKANVKLDIIPVIDPWGYNNGSRLNKNDVNINRDYINQVSAEAQAMTSYLETIREDIYAAIDCHSTSGHYCYLASKTKSKKFGFLMKAINEISAACVGSWDTVMTQIGRSLDYRNYAYGCISANDGTLCDYLIEKGMTDISCTVETVKETGNTAIPTAKFTKDIVGNLIQMLL